MGVGRKHKVHRPLCLKTITECRLVVKDFFYWFPLHYPYSRRCRESVGPLRCTNSKVWDKPKNILSELWTSPNLSTTSKVDESL